MLCRPPHPSRHPARPPELRLELSDSPGFGVLGTPRLSHLGLAGQLGTAGPRLSPCLPLKTAQSFLSAAAVFVVHKLLRNRVSRDPELPCHSSMWGLWLRTQCEEVSLPRGSSLLSRVQVTDISRSTGTFGLSECSSHLPYAYRRDRRTSRNQSITSVRLPWL